MEKLTFKRGKVNLHVGYNWLTDWHSPHIVAYWAGLFAAINIQLPSSSGKFTIYFLFYFYCSLP